jgi:pimeloyl-ACP methyl ester carboxylesterase
MTLPRKSIVAFSLPASLIVLTLIGACATTPRSELFSAENASECVVVLHGANRSWRSMRPLAKALRAGGYTTVNVDYPSRAGRVDELVPLAVETGLKECRATGAHLVHFVAHSLGGILLRYAHEREPIDDLGRVVMLAPPNTGSEIIDKTRGIPGSTMIAGEALMQLGTDAESVPAQLGPVTFELGVIAGTRTINPLLSTMLPNPDDGKVSVARTRVGGMTDFLVVEDSHHFMLTDDVVSRNTLLFLQTGAFAEDDKAAMTEATH